MSDEEWKKIVQQIIDETDPEKIAKLCRELMFALELHRSKRRTEKRADRGNPEESK